MFPRPGFSLSVLLLVLTVPLAAAEPPRDRFGDPLPDGAVARLGSMRLCDEQFITGAAFSPDGKTLMGTGDGRTISVWDPATGKLVRRVTALKPGATGLHHFSADGKTLILAGYDGITRFLDTATGAEKHTLTHGRRGFTRALAVSDDGKVLVTIHQGTVVIWDVPSGKELHELKIAPNVPLPNNALLTLTPDGKQLILPHTDGSLHVTDVASGKEVRALEMPPATPGMHPSMRVQRLAISPDGRYVAFGGFSNRLSLCELATGKRVRELSYPQNTITGLAFTPNSRLLALSTFQGIYLFGVLSGKELRHIPRKYGVSNALVFSPDGRTLASLVGGFRIDLWDVAAGRSLHPPTGHVSQVLSLAFFADGKRLASSAGDGQILVWDLASSREIARRSVFTFGNSLELAEDGRTLQFVASDRAVHRWEPATDRDEQRPSGTLPMNANRFILSPDGRSVAVVTFDRKIYLQDLKPGASPRLLMQTQNWNASICFSPDSRRLLTSDWDNSRQQILHLWDRATAKAVRELKPESPFHGMPMHLAFFRDGRSLALYDGRISVREIASGGDRLPPIQIGGISVLTVSPDGRLLVYGQQDGTIVVRGTATGKELAQLRGGQGMIHALAFSRDGRLLASGGNNGTILIWQMPDGEGLPATLTPNEAAALWQALGATDAVRGNRALSGLTAAPASAVPLLKERLRTPPKPPDEKRLAQLIADLEDDSFKVRERATRELAAAGPAAADALRKALADVPSEEAKRRIEDLLQRLSKGGASEHLRSLRALEVLERIGTSEAKDVLRELARKPLPVELDEEIRASLRRMGERP